MASAPAAVIKPIDNGTIHRICSGQVILDLATAVKELVENALDAGATSIEIRLKEYGSELLEVADNGHGVSSDNYQALTLKYHTSKISDFGDLQELGTFGFRGEALSSLCAVADVTVVTRTSGQEAGVRLSYDSNGVLVGQTGAARTVGTTVAVRDLFKRLPVRHKEFLRHIKREYARLVTLLQAYALISTGVRLICTNQVGNGARTTVVNTQCSSSVRDNILAVFGGKTANGMEPLHVEDEESGVTAVGWVSKATANSGRAAGDRQFFFLNGRPVDLLKAAKLLNETYRSLSSPAAASSKPMAVVDFRLPPDSYDVNVTPDKRKVFLHAEKRILEAFQRGLQVLWEPSRNTYDVHDVLGATQHAAQQAQRSASGGKAAGATGTRTMQSFSQFAGPPNPAAQGGATGASPAPNRRHCRQEEAAPEEQEQGGTAIEAGGQGSPAAGGAATTCSPPEVSGEPPAKRRALLPLAAFALRGGSSRQQAAAGPASQDAQQQQPVARQRSLFRFGFQREAAPCSQDGGPREEQEGEEAQQQHEEQHGMKEVEHGQAAAATCPGSDALHALQQPAATAAVLQTTPLMVLADEGEQQQQVQAQQPHRAAAGEESEDDAMYELSDAEEGSSPGGVVAAAAPGGQDGTEAVAAAEGMAYATTSGGDITAAADLAGMRRRLLAAARLSAAIGQQGGRRKRSQFAAASLVGSNPAGGGSSGCDGMLREQAKEVAEQELARVFSKGDFLRLDVLGQFNLGFILARLGRDLFIIDQHASDEKYNFERLQRTTTLNRQPLLAPQALELSPTEELTVRDNLDVFHQNGFDFADDPATGRLLLSAVPFSKNTTFGVGDILELVMLLDSGVAAPSAVSSRSTDASAGQPGTVVRPSRVRAMLASRACRSSIMIGRALEPRTMCLILEHLSQLHAPWNCPHGRPTMRHLALLPPPQPALQP